MAIDFTNPNEPKLNPSQATRYFASSRRGRPVHKSRIIRYILDGVRGPNGVLVRLEAMRQGHQWVTTPSAIQAFCEALTPKRVGLPVTPRNVGPSKADELADRELGISGY